MKEGHAIMSFSFTMITSRAELLQALQQYPTHSEEAKFLNPFITLLQHEGCYQRDFLPGHVTGSAWIIDTTYTHVLLTHHAKLNRWLQPGGHADGDENIFAVALREATEETGINHFLDSLQPIFDIDIHTIPARMDFPEHQHYDVRFLFMADVNTPLIITAESNDLKWFPLETLDAITDNASLIRMRNKILELKRSN
jgi:8-oxo-dGTP pyrophosphatase MutT (NUDIX family)